MTKQTLINEIWFFTIPWKLEIASSIFGILILNAVPVSSVKSDTLQKKTNTANMYQWKIKTDFIFVGVNNYVLCLNQTHFSIAKVKITYKKKPTHISIITLEGIENSKQKLKPKRATKESKQSCEHFQVKWLVFFPLKKHYHQTWLEVPTHCNLSFKTKDSWQDKKDFDKTRKESLKS